MLCQEIDHLLRTQIIERRLQEVRLRMNMPAELIPCLQVGEVASSLSCDHDLASRALHLLQHQHTSAAAKRCSCSCSRHESGCSATYDYNLC